MPANLTPDYLRAEEEYKKASTPQERLEALKKMYAAMPKHKGTDKLQADIKRRIAAVRDEIQKGDKKKGFGIKVDVEGAGQVTLAGPPNSGKSQLVAALTGTHLEVAPYPFTTRLPQPAMMLYEDIQIQLVDLPPISRQHMDFWVPNVIRTSNMLLLVFDLSDQAALEQIDETRAILEEAKLKLVPYKPTDEHWASVIEKRTLFVGTKLDMPGAEETWSVIQELYRGSYNMIAVSAVAGHALTDLKQLIFLSLNIVRIYSKPPGKETDLTRPFTLPKGSTLLQFATAVHRDFAEHLKFARLWGHGKFEGQRINRDYILQDRDIIELHA